MMELTHVIVLVIVGYATASPYGYGTKGGAAAKASATAGAYTGVGDVPINTPSNTGYSGSFSKTYSSSSSASSASSSSSSFSYSGSGSVGSSGAVGGVGRCVSENCQETPVAASQGSAGEGSQTYGGSNAAAIAGGFGGKIPSASYGHKYNYGGSQVTQAQNCASGSCQESTNSDNPNGSGTLTDSQSLNNAKAEASAGTILTTGSGDCSGSTCNNSPGTNPKCTSSGCSSNDNIECASKNCGSDSHTSVPSPHVGDEKPCTSGLCKPNLNTESIPSTDYGTNDIQIFSPVNTDSKSNSGAHSDNDKTSSTESNCSGGNCGPSASAEIKPYHNLSPAPEIATAPGQNKPATYLTTPKLESPCTSPNCQKAQDNLTGHGSNQNTFDFSPSAENNPSCVSGNCGYSKTPYTLNSENVNNFNQAPSLSQGEPSKPVYSQGSSPSYSPVKPSGQPCTPGIPGCGVTQSANGSPPPSVYDGDTQYKPSYPHGSAGQTCAPGTPGCASVPSNCKEGNCGTHPSSPIFGGPTNISPDYDSEISSSHSGNAAGTHCAPGTPGCTIPSSASECSSGNCDVSLYSPGSSNKPILSHVTPSTNLHVYPSGQSCLPGSAGCSSATSSNTYGGSFNTKPFGTSSSPYSHGKPSDSSCAPGSVGCAPTSSDCISGQCAGKPSFPGYTGFASSYPSGSTCAPGSPGCVIGPIASGPCASGNCGISPSPAFSGSTNIQLPGIDLSSKNPSDIHCIPGTPNCASNSPVSPEINLSPVCSPGTPGCSSSPSSTAHESSYAIKPSYDQESYINFPPYSSAQPSGPACLSGSPGCIPSQIIQPPICAPGSPKCPQGSLTNTGSFAPGYGVSGVESSLPHAIFGSHGTGSLHVVHNKPISGIPQLPTQIPNGSGSFVTPSSTYNNYHLHNSVSGLSGSGSYTPAPTPVLPFAPPAPVLPGIGSPSSIPSSGSSSFLINNVEAAAGTSGHGNPKDKHITYTGGFGGPGGILKPNEYNISPPSISSKPSIGSATIPAPCISGNCPTSGQAPPSPIHTVSNSAAETSAVAAASAEAVAYTGGFGGPPGLLKPYDGGKIDIKGPSGNQFQHSSPDLHQGLGKGSGSLSYSNGGLQAGGIAAAQANAGSISSIGHGISGTGGCGGGCGGSSDHNGSLGYSNLGVSGDSKNIADSLNAGAVAKSIANAASGARAFGGSYASSSASAHATAGSSVKGGYGRR